MQAAGCLKVNGLQGRTACASRRHFSRLLRLPGVWVRKVRFEPDRVIVEVALCRRRLVYPECGHSTAARKDTRPDMSVWRHLDLGVWRLEVRLNDLYEVGIDAPAVTTNAKDEPPAG